MANLFLRRAWQMKSFLEFRCESCGIDIRRSIRQKIQEFILFQTGLVHCLRYLVCKKPDQRLAFFQHHNDLVIKPGYYSYIGRWFASVALPEVVWSEPERSATTPRQVGGGAPY